MKTIGNIIWFLFGGFFGAILYFIAGLLFCVTVVGIPVGVQCFKKAGLMLWPFGKQIVYGDSVFSFLVNVIWLIIFGWWFALVYLIIGLVYCITIIGIPFGKQCFKLSKLSLAPFGARVCGQ